MLHKSFRFSSSAQNSLIRKGGVVGSGNSSSSESVTNQRDLWNYSVAIGTDDDI